VVNSELKALRQEADLTQEEVAQSLDVSARTVKNWEGGFTNPEEPYRSAIAELDLLRQENGAGAVSSVVRKSSGILELASIIHS
jgi:DNA-binding transcriptional regulator YiaG